MHANTMTQIRGFDIESVEVQSISQMKGKQHKLPIDEKTNGWRSCKDEVIVVSLGLKFH